MRNFFRHIADLFSALKREKLHRQVIIYFLIVFICGTLVYFFERGEAQSLYKNIWDGIWWGFVTISTTGYGDKFPISTLGRLSGIFIMLAGMVVTVTISGTIASILVDRKLKEGQGLQKLNTTGHIVVCGWNSHGDKILEGFQTLANKSKQKMSVVLVNELPIEQLNEVQFSYASKNLSIEIVRGKFTQQPVLEKANIAKAESVIILADVTDENGTANADERTILAVYTVSNMNPSAHISVEIINKQNEQHLKNTPVENIVVTGDFNSFLLAHSAVNPGIPQAAKEIMNLNFRNTLSSVPFPHELVGKKFSDAFGYFKTNKDILLIGIVSVSKKLSIDSFLSDDPSSIDEFIKRKFAESERDYFADTGGKTQTILNPPWDYEITNNDQALIIGEEKKGA
jgi:voltage-gated potassium channel